MSPIVEFKNWLIESSSMEYWGQVSKIDDGGDHLEIYADHIGGNLYLPKDAKFTDVSKWPVGKTLNPPWTKYFQYYKDASGNNIVTYVENRAVDIVCHNQTHNAVYLIRRKNPPIGIALPGGFFDSIADNFDANNPPEPSQVGRIAAARELAEETKVRVNPSNLRFIGKFSTGDSDTRDKVFNVWAYSYAVSDEDMKLFKFGDDAGQSPGDENMQEKGFKGWYSLDRMPTLVFDHHNQILAKLHI